MKELLSQLSNQIEEFLKTAIEINRSNTEAIKKGEINLNDREALLKGFKEQISQIDYISQIYFGTESGEFYGVLSIGDVLITDFAGVSNNFREPYFEYLKKTYGLQEPRTYKSTQRPWYQKAVARKETGSIVYSAPVADTTLKFLTLFSPVFDDLTKNLLGVAGVDINLRNLSELLIDFTPESGVIKAKVENPEEIIFALPPSVTAANLKTPVLSQKVSTAGFECTLQFFN